MENIFFNELTKVSNFTNEDLDDIYVLKNEIIATDGYRAIILKCIMIPKEFQNKRINTKFTSFDDIHKENLHAEDIIFTEKIKKIINFHLKKNRKLDENIITLEVKNFMKRFFYKEKIEQNLIFIKNSQTEERVAINKDYLNIALNSFDEDSKVTVFYPHYSLAPIIIKNDYQLVLIMPNLTKVCVISPTSS